MAPGRLSERINQCCSLGRKGGRSQSDKGKS